MSSEQVPAKLFDEAQGVALQAQSDAAAIARATQEIQAALVIGQRFPRDEVKAKTRIVEACKRKELAEAAEYEYSRGGTRITGPTIDLLRAIANRWGNIRFGWSEVERRDGQSLVRCFAWDMQSNGQAERTFNVKHWRDTQAGGYALDDERDIYELIANQAARRVRACLEEVIDADVVTAAIEQCRVTMKTGEKTPLTDRAVQMITAFKEFGITQPMIETKLGNKLDAISENQLASLRRIFKALKDGVGKREDYFKPETLAPAFETPKADSATPAADPATKSPEPATQGNGFNPLKAVRNLARMSHVPEGKILSQLAADGTTDGSHTSLEEVALAADGREILQALCDQWPDFVSRIAAGKEAA